MLKLSTEGTTHINIWIIIYKKDKKKISCTLTHSSIKHSISNDVNQLCFRREWNFIEKGEWKIKMEENSLLWKREIVLFSEPVMTYLVSLIFKFPLSWWKIVDMDRLSETISHSWGELLHEGFAAVSPWTWPSGACTPPVGSSPSYLCPSLSSHECSFLTTRKSPHPGLYTDLSYLCPSILFYPIWKYLYLHTFSPPSSTELEKSVKPFSLLSCSLLAPSISSLFIVFQTLPLHWFLPLYSVNYWSFLS